MSTLLIGGCKGKNNTPAPERIDDGGQVAPAPEDVEPKASELKEEDYKDFPSYYLRKLTSYNTYKSVTKGETLAKVMGVPTTQSIDVTVIKSEYSYMMNESHSLLVNTTHEVYYHEKEALYRDNGAENFTLDNLTSYLNKYGTYPFDNAIEGYSVAQDSITKIEKLTSQTDYKFHLEFDNEKATNNVKIQMKQFGGLDDYPVFSKVEMDITVKDDFTPVSIDLHTMYDAKMFLTSNCEQNYTVTFSDYNVELEVPNLESVKGMFTNN